MPTVEMGLEKCAARHGGLWAARVSTVGRRIMAGVTEQHLFFDDALLQAGWAPDVRIPIPAGTIAAVEADSPPPPGDTRPGTAPTRLPNPPTPPPHPPTDPPTPRS